MPQNKVCGSIQEVFDRTLLGFEQFTFVASPKKRRCQNTTTDSDDGNDNVTTVSAGDDVKTRDKPRSVMDCPELAENMCTAKFSCATNRHRRQAKDDS